MASPGDVSPTDSARLTPHPNPLPSPGEGTKPINLGVLVSGSGTTLQNLIDRIADGALNAKIGLVIGSRPDLPGLKRAADAKLMNFVVNRAEFAPDDCAAFSRQVFRLCDDADVDLVCL